MRTRLMTTLLLVLTTTAAAQTAQLTGRVTDASGAVVIGAAVIVTNLETGIEKETLTNAAGFFTVPQLQPGNYRLTGRMTGFKTVTQTGLKLNVDQVARIDLMLEVGQVTELTSVSGGAPLVETETSATGQVIDNKRVVELPLNGRNFVQLAGLTPGILVRGSSQFTAEPTVNINGLRGGATGFLVDGAENYEQNA